MKALGVSQIQKLSKNKAVNKPISLHQSFNFWPLCCSHFSPCIWKMIIKAFVI